MPPNRFESEVESFLEGSHGDRTHIKRADHHTVTPLCGTLLLSRCVVPIRMRGSYPNAPFLSGCLHGVIHRAAIHYRLYPQATV